MEKIEFYTVNINLSAGIGVWVVKSEWKELKQAFIMSNESDAEKLCKILNRQANIDFKNANKLRGKIN
jgi:hypothetical protein